MSIFFSSAIGIFATTEDQFEVSAEVVASPAPSVTPSREGGGSGQFIYPIISDLIVEPSQTGAKISWKTNIPTKDNLEWGRTQDYELGKQLESSFSTQHQVVISGLTPNTLYFFSITSVSSYGATTRLERQTFVTSKFIEGYPNPINFRALALENEIELTWKNPTNPEFKEVRLVKSDKFFPADPDDGEVIYEGTSEKNIDDQVKKGTTYYYALFAKEKDGTFSSGVLAKARILLPGERPEEEKEIFETLPKAPTVHPQIQALNFFDFDFIQNGKILEKQGAATVAIDGKKNLTITLDYGKVPEVLKSIVFTLTHPSNKEKKFSFLLRINQEKTFYTASLAPLGESGLYKVNIAIVDFKNQGLKKITGALLASVQSAAILPKKYLIYFFKSNFIKYLLLLLILIIAYEIYKNLRDRRKNQVTAIKPNVSGN